MKNKILALLLLGSAFLISCDSSDQAHEEPPQEEPLKILVIGNSITRHGAAPDIGWYGEWGMAASAPDKDFCAIVESTTGGTLEKLRAGNWEVNFEYDQLSEATMKDPDVLIVELGENVTLSTPEMEADYEIKIVQLVNKYRQQNTKVLLISNFWYDVKKDSIENRTCQNNNYTFIDISELNTGSDYEQYMAIEEYGHTGVGIHPNDLAMQIIANKILNAINQAN